MDHNIHQCITRHDQWTFMGAIQVADKYDSLLLVSPVELTSDPVNCQSPNSPDIFVDSGMKAKFLW